MLIDENIYQTPRLKNIKSLKIPETTEGHQHVTNISRGLIFVV